MKKFVLTAAAIFMISAAGYADLNQDYLEAAKNGDNDMVKILIEKGASINAKDRDGWTALMHASKNGNRGLVEMLLGKKADPKVKDNRGNTALMHAKVKNRKAVVDLLTAAGVKE